MGIMGSATQSDSERSPLLGRGSGQRNFPQHGRKLSGPLEISSSTRQGILIGIWLAQFLSVCTFVHIIFLELIFFDH